MRLRHFLSCPSRQNADPPAGDDADFFATGDIPPAPSSGMGNFPDLGTLMRCLGGSELTC